MIKHFEIQNFKSHKETKLDFSNLTLFCGKNSGGKSAVIHALLLLRESYFSNYKFDYLDLKSNPVNIGTAKDALYQYSGKDEISFLAKTELDEYTFLFKAEDLTKTYISKLKHSDNISKIKDESLFNTNCQFVSAARLGPQQTYLKDDVVVDKYNQISIIEGKAEHFVHFLQKYKDIRIKEELRSPTIKQDDLFSQVTAWEREISNGVNVIIKDSGILGYELKYQYNTENGKTDEFSAANVGFGLSYTMPVLVAILSAPKDAIIFIENPEAHLHPKGQAKLAELICLATQSGVQIVIETHSDHIFNGVCKAILKKKIDKEKVKCHYFELNKENATESTEIQFSDNGRVLNYKEGLFDQFDNDLDELIGLK
jgi:predicted ATPase